MSLPPVNTPDLVGRHLGKLGSLTSSPGGQVSLGIGQSAVETKLRRSALDAVEAVVVLVENDLVASGGTLARDDGRVGKEELPDLGFQK